MRPTNDITVYQSRVRSFDAVIEVIRPIKPAHMTDMYEFYGCAFDRAFGWSTDAFPTNDDSIPIPQFRFEFGTGFAALHEYDGTWLVGSFDSCFSTAYDSHFGGYFSTDDFSTDFHRPA